MRRVCWDCGIEYSPNLGENGRLPKGYRICPKCQSTNTKEYRRPIFKSLGGSNPLSLGTPSFVMDCWMRDVKIHNSQMCA